MKTILRDVLKQLASCATRSPKTTAAGLSALLCLALPAHSQQIVPISLLLVGVLAADTDLDPPSAPTGVTGA